MTGTNKYETSRYWAISGIGYGRGFSPEEAVANYVSVQLSNYPAKNTIFKTKPKWKAALETGEAKARVWLAPEGTTGFVLDGKIRWTHEDEDGKTVYTVATIDQEVDYTPQKA